MKRFCSFVLVLLLVFVLCIPASAEDALDCSYTRFNDFAGAVTEDEEAQLNAKVRARIADLQMDLPVCVYLTRASTSSLSDFAADFYARNHFGYGEEKSGIILVLDLEKAVFDIYYYGEADALIGEQARQTLSDKFKADCRNESLTYYQAFDRYYDAVFAMVENARLHPAATRKKTAFREDGMPSWYPENTEGFQDFHGEDLPPVVDDANIFTDEQYQTLSEKISAMNERLGISYVAFTSKDNHGLKPEEYSSDFLHFNGYGVGDEYGAVVFYLSLDPDDRCWLTTSINAYERLFTFNVTYEIDEMVDSSIRGGAYYEAFVMHADYVDKLFSSMSENLPDWYPEGTRTYELDRTGRTYAQKVDQTKPCIVDSADLLTPAQREMFETELQNLSLRYDLDIVVFTDSVCHAPNTEEYARDFYYFNGYAADGIYLYWIKTDHNSFDILYYGAGEKYEKLDLVTEIRSFIANKSPDEAMTKYAELLTFMLEKDRLPMHAGTAGLCFFIALGAGLIAAGVILEKMKKSMTITRQESTYSYLVNGSFRLFNKSTHFLYSTVTRTAKPKPSESSGSSGGSSSRGGSTYTSGRSAGGSYSSGGRRF